MSDVSLYLAMSLSALSRALFLFPPPSPVLLCAGFEDSQVNAREFASKRGWRALECVGERGTEERDRERGADRESGRRRKQHDARDIRRRHGEGGA